MAIGDVLIDAGESAPNMPTSMGAPATAHQFQQLQEGMISLVEPRALALLHDVEMGVTAELGRRRMTVRELLSLTPGAVIELDRAAGSPVDVLVNGTLIARGEVVVIDEEFGIRVSEIVATADLAL
jgi:flagellar motor switch protein FliN/FliY